MQGVGRVDMQRGRVTGRNDGLVFFPTAAAAGVYAAPLPYGRLFAGWGVQTSIRPSFDMATRAGAASCSNPGKACPLSDRDCPHSEFSFFTRPASPVRTQNRASFDPRPRSNSCLSLSPGRTASVSAPRGVMTWVRGVTETASRAGRGQWPGSMNACNGRSPRRQNRQSHQAD